MSAQPFHSWRDAFTQHWKQYVAEGFALGTFMVAACLVTLLLFHPDLWPGRNMPLLGRLALTGLAMGITAVILIKSPIGKLSGAHMNPAVTITFWRLGRIATPDATFYIVAQFIGGALGVWISKLVSPTLITHPAVNYAITVPGAYGTLVALGAEILMTFVLMSMVLVTSGHPKWKEWTPYFVGVLLTLYITFEAPISGMSLNPARTVASGLFASDWRALWIYFVGPLAGMLAAAEIKQLRERSFCAKLNHARGTQCIFCEYALWEYAAAPKRGDD